MASICLVFCTLTAHSHISRGKVRQFCQASFTQSLLLHHSLRLSLSGGCAKLRKNLIFVKLKFFTLVEGENDPVECDLITGNWAEINQYLLSQFSILAEFFYRKSVNQSLKNFNLVESHHSVVRSLSPNIYLCMFIRTRCL